MDPHTMHLPPIKRRQHNHLIQHVPFQRVGKVLPSPSRRPLRQPVNTPQSLDTNQVYILLQQQSIQSELFGFYGIFSGSA